MMIIITIMGKCETATASIGIKILLSDVTSQMNETNFDLIMEMIENGFIEDDNDYFNEVYQEIVGNNNDSNCSEVKEYLTNEFKNKGTLNKYKCSKREDHTLSYGCLLDKHLIVPVKKILMTERYGYDRYGTNCSSRPIDFDLSVNVEKYKDIKKYEIVFLLSQDSG